MSIYGKILAVLNVLAAVGFVVVAGMDWGQRERWSYAVFRHDLFIDGLPIDAKEEDANGAPRVDNLSDKTLNAILGSNPVKTQEAEVERVRGLVRSKIDSADVPGTRGQKLARYLRSLARTESERETLGQLMTAPDKDEVTADLEKQLNQQFDSVKEARDRSIGARKANAARLLFCLGDALHEDPNTDFLASPAYKRYVNVVGLSAAAQAAEDQATVLQKMTEEAISAHEAERRQFVYDHGQIVYNTLNLADDVERQEQMLNAKKAEVDKQKLLVEERKVQIAKLREELKGLQQKTADKLAEQAHAEQEVMDRLIDLRNTSKKNQELERQIRELEGASGTR
jgi:hypothetical protein